MKKNIIILLTLTIGTNYHTVKAQQPDLIKGDTISFQLMKIAKPESKINWIKFKDSLNINPTNVFTEFKAAFNLKENDKMLLTKIEKDDLGYSHYKYLQYYKDIRIDGGIYTVHTNKKGITYAANGKILNGIDISVVPNLNEKQAIEIGLKNNYDIRISNNESGKQENNNTSGNAGMLPELDANGTYSKSSNSLKQKYNTGAEVNRDASASTNLNASLNLGWTIFDGMKMFRTKEKLSEISLQSRDQLKIQIETSLQEIITAYYTIVRNTQLLKSMREELILSEERLKISERKMKNGLGSRLDWLQVQTEYNRQHSLEIQLQSDAATATIHLNRLLGRDLEINYIVEDTVIINYNPAIDDLKKSVSENNNILNFYKRNLRISELELKENRSLRSPVIRLNTNYVFSKVTNEAGFSLLNQTQGFNYGATATIPLFHGFNINRQIKNSKLNILNAGIEKELYTLSVKEELLNAFRIFRNNIEILQIEEQNILYAKEVMNIAQERYKIGVSTATEQQESLKTFEDAVTRLTNARYQSKISETTLKRLNGELVK